MSYSIIYNSDAILDLMYIKAYIKYYKQNPKLADAVEQSIKQAIKLLDFSPKQYAVIGKTKGNQEVRRMPVKKYNVYYSVDDQVNVVTIYNIVYSGVDINQIAIN